jgi:hypothetical protein
MGDVLNASLRAKRGNPFFSYALASPSNPLARNLGWWGGKLRAGKLDCFVASLLAMTKTLDSARAGVTERQLGSIVSSQYAVANLVKSDHLPRNGWE